MNFKKAFFVLITSALLLASCGSSGKMGKGGGCNCNKGMSGY